MFLVSFKRLQNFVNVTALIRSGANAVNKTLEVFFNISLCHVCMLQW